LVSSKDFINAADRRSQHALRRADNVRMVAYLRYITTLALKNWSLFLSTIQIGDSGLKIRELIMCASFADTHNPIVE
jgi:hypothetical protein